MFSAIRNGGVQAIIKRLVATENLSNVKFISTCDGAQNSENILERNKFGPGEMNRPQKSVIRTLSTQNHTRPIAARTTSSKDDTREFMAVFPDIVRDLTEKASKYDSQNIPKHLAKSLQYNVLGGKQNRGLATVLTYKQLVDSSQLTPENIRLAQYMGWCVEMLQAYFVICDDIMDESISRRGQPCWYKLDEIGFSAINDGLMIENCIYHILKKYFDDKSYYIKLVELWHDVIFITSIGQSLDLNTASKDPSHFTMENYNAIVSNKTAYYTFYLPVALAMHLAGFTDPEAFRQAKIILLEIGHFFQVQDDFIDCFGDSAVTGKVGTDIQDNKCSWLAVVCMQRASDEQKQIMRECYGQKDPAKVERVKNLYKELGLPNIYANYEEETYNMIKTHIQQSSRGFPHEIFYNMLDTIYRRVS